MTVAVEGERRHQREGCTSAELPDRDECLSLRLLSWCSHLGLDCHRSIRRSQGRTHGVCQVGHGIPCGSTFYLINSALFTYKYLQQILLVCLASPMLCLLVLNQEVTSSNLCSCNFRLHFLFPISLFSFFCPFKNYLYIICFYISSILLCPANSF